MWGEVNWTLVYWVVVQSADVWWSELLQKIDKKLWHLHKGQRSSIGMGIWTNLIYSNLNKTVLLCASKKFMNKCWGHYCLDFVLKWQEWLCFKKWQRILQFSGVNYLKELQASCVKSFEIKCRKLLEFWCKRVCAKQKTIMFQVWYTSYLEFKVNSIIEKYSKYSWNWGRNHFEVTFFKEISIWYQKYH